MNNQLGKLPNQMKLGEKLDSCFDRFRCKVFTRALCGIEKLNMRKIETGFGFASNMKDEVVEKLITQTLTQSSASLKVLFYNPSDLLFQKTPVREEVRKTEINRLGIDYVIDTITSVDKQENDKLGVKVRKKH